MGEQRQGGWEAPRKSVGGFPKGSLLGTDHDQTHCRHLLGRAADQSTEASLRASLPPEDSRCRADSWRCFWQLRVWKCVGGDGQASWPAHRWLVSSEQGLSADLAAQSWAGPPITSKPLWPRLTKPAKYFPCCFMRC